MDKELVKAVVGLVASAGVSRVINNAIKATSPYEMTKLDKFLVGTGSMVITGVAANIAVEYTNSQVDFAYQAVQNIRNGKSGFIVGESTNEQ